jgi:hypothetical protein
VIILIAVQEKQVAITDQFATTPITGRQSIFARVSAPTQTGYLIEIVGVYTDLDSASTARANHAKKHVGRRYVQKVAQLNDGTVTQDVNHCITCNAVIGEVGSFCGPCRQAHYEESRQLDEMGGAPDPVPLIPATVGPGAIFRNGQ